MSNRQSNTTDLDDGAEPAGISDILKADWPAIGAHALVWVQRVDEPQVASLAFHHLLRVLRQAAFQYPIHPAHKSIGKGLQISN